MHINAVMFEEALILNRNDRLYQTIRNVGEVQRHALFHRRAVECAERDRRTGTAIGAPRHRSGVEGRRHSALGIGNVCADQCFTANQKRRRKDCHGSPAKDGANGDPSAKRREREGCHDMYDARVVEKVSK